MPETPITADPAILGGKPFIRGTRISVEFILELIASGATLEEIVRIYPQINRHEVESAVRFAAEYLRRDEMLEFEIRR